MRECTGFPLSVFTCGCYLAQSGGATVNWDEWGAPPIYAANDQELFYAEGSAQMQLHGDLIFQLYGRSRGRAAEYWGKEKLAEDIMLHTLLFKDH